LFEGFKLVHVRIISPENKMMNYSN